MLKAISSSLRLQVLNLLFDRGPLSYTEIMNLLSLSPSRDAGRFAYHLKLLLKADLIEPDVETKKYQITGLGQMIIGVAESIEKQVSTRKKMLVRTSRLAIEKFDRNKIVESLLREANVPIDLAQKIAQETESRLLRFKTKYLTAPLIREFVNAILIERGLEDYRHKLTRLGLPVYEVTQLIKSVEARSLGVEAVHKAAGDAVIGEYTLLNVLPRDISDAHLSGSIHINNLGCWILKINEFMHDLRFFFQGGLNLGKSNLAVPSFPPPKNFESALLMASNLLKIAATEISGEQAIDFFNVFLAPYVKNLPRERVRAGLRFFLFNLNQSLTGESLPIATSLGLEFIVPDFLADYNAIGPGGKKIGHYADFVEESRLIAFLLMELMLKNEGQKPFFNPGLIFKIRPSCLEKKECEPLIHLSHRLAAWSGLPYFANLCPNNQKHSSYTATGCRFATDWKSDWELDTLQTGNIDHIIINLARISYDAKGNKKNFQNMFNEPLSLALRALEIKYQTIKQRLKEGLLPFLSQKVNGNQYLRLENASRLVSFVGLNETVQSFLGKSIYKDKVTLDFAEEIIKNFSDTTGMYSRKPETRVSLAMTPNPDAAQRLAELDIEKYGWATVSVRGKKENPFYTDLVAAPLDAPITLEERLSVEERLHKLSSGGHLAILRLDNSEQSAKEFLSTTKLIVKKYDVGLYVYDRDLTFCENCKENFFGVLFKCPRCGSANMLTSFSRAPARHLPTPFWGPAQRLVLNK